MKQQLKNSEYHLKLSEVKKIIHATNTFRDRALIETLYAVRAGEKAGIQNLNPALKHINPHLFRHSIARYLRNKEFSAEWIQKFLGHPLLISIKNAEKKLFSNLTFGAESSMMINKGINVA